MIEDKRKEPPHPSPLPKGEGAKNKEVGSLINNENSLYNEFIFRKKVV